MQYHYDKSHFCASLMKAGLLSKSSKVPSSTLVDVLLDHLNAHREKTKVNSNVQSSEIA